MATIKTIMKSQSCKKSQRKQRGSGGVLAPHHIPASRLTGFLVQPTLFPVEFKGVMTYTSYFALTPAAGAISDQVFRLNSIYDPDYSGVGSTVMGYTQANALYQRYRVLAARVHVQWDNMSSDPVVAYAVASPNTTISSNIGTIQAQRLSWSSPVAGKGGPPKTHTLSMPIYKVFGVPQMQVRTEHDFAAALGANPSNSVYLHVGIYQNGSSSGNCNVFIKIEYEVILSMPYDIVA